MGSIKAKKGSAFQRNALCNTASQHKESVQDALHLTIFFLPTRTKEGNEHSRLECSRLIRKVVWSHVDNSLAQANHFINDGTAFVNRHRFQKQVEKMVM